MNPARRHTAYDVITGEKKWQFTPFPCRANSVRHVAEGRVQVCRRCEQLGFDVHRRRARHRLHSLGSANYDFYGADRIGQNLFAKCIMALDARTGKRLCTSNGASRLWDFDNVSAPQLVTVRHNGRRVDAVAHAGKTGFM